MKKMIMLVVMSALLGWAAYAQKPNGVYAISGTPLKINETTSRTVCGGTIINVTYKGSKFSPSIKGAFEYACKLVEDAIPTTFPLNVSVSFVRMSDNSCLASVTSNPDNIGVMHSLGVDKVWVTLIPQHYKF